MDVGAQTEPALGVYHIPKQGKGGLGIPHILSEIVSIRVGYQASILSAYGPKCVCQASNVSTFREIPFHGEKIDTSHEAGGRRPLA